MRAQEFLRGPKLLILILIALGGMGVLAALALFIHVRMGCGENLNQSGETFARQAIETISENWDHEAMLKLMPPQARDRPELVSALRNTCTKRRFELGDRTQPVQVEGQAVGRFNLNQMAFATARYSSRCTFKWGSATISLDLAKNLKIAGPNGQWFLVNISFSGIDN